MIPIQGSTRESFTVSEESTGKQFRCVLGGPELSNTEWCSCLDFVAQAVTTAGFVVASGSLSPGVPDDVYARIVHLAREHGARCIVDASNYPRFAEFLVANGIDSISLNPDSFLKSIDHIATAEAGRLQPVPR